MKTLLVVAACVSMGFAWADDPSTRTLTFDTDTTISDSTPYVCNKLVVKANLTLDGAGVVFSNGYPNAAITLGGADVDHPVSLTVTNDAVLVTRKHAKVSVLNHGGQFRVFCQNWQGATWGRQTTADETFWATSTYPSFCSQLGYDLAITVDSGVVAGPDGVLDLAWLGGVRGALGCANVDNRSATVPVRLVFDGGSVRNAQPNATTCPTLFTGVPGSRTILEGVNGKPIYIRNQYNYGVLLADDNVTLVTTGACDVTFGPGNTTPPLYTLSGNVEWNHTGNVVVYGINLYKIGTDNFLPYGPGKGDVYMTMCTNDQTNTSSDPRYMCRLDLNGKTVNVNSFIGLGNTQKDAGGIRDRTFVTNLVTAARGTMIVGAQVENSRLTGFFGGPVDVRKQGSGTLRVGETLTRIENGAAFYLDEGTAILSGKVEKIESLTLAQGTKLVVDGIEVLIDYLQNNGGEIEYRNGGALTLVQADGGERLHANLQPQEGSIRVEQGTLTLSGDTCTNEFWRFSVCRIGRKDNGNYYAELGRIVLLDSADMTLEYGKYPTDHALSTGLVLAGDQKVYVSEEIVSSSVYLTNYVYEVSTAAKDLQPGRVTLPPGKSWPEGLNGRSWKDASVLFKTSNFNDIMRPYGAKVKDNIRIQLSDPATWPQIYWRLNVGKSATGIRSYSMLQSGYNSDSLMPDTWILETSPDGVTWETADARENIPPAVEYTDPSNTSTRKRGGSWYCDGVPFTLAGAKTAHLNGAAGLAASANLQVDAGATFDGSYVTGGSTEVHALTLDCAKGAGTLKGVRLATSGTLYIKKGAARMPYGDLGYAFDAAFASGDLSGWKVVVDGVEKPLVTLVWEDGKLTLRPGGMVILVR